MAELITEKGYELGIAALKIVDTSGNVLLTLPVVDGTSGQVMTTDGDGTLTFTTVSDTVRAITAGGNTLASGETLAFTAGSNITITENAGAVTIAATDDDTVRTVTAGGNTLATGETLAITAGTNITITEDAGVVTITAATTGISVGKAYAFSSVFN